MGFARWLVENKVLSIDVAVEALLQQQRSNKLVSEISVSEGYLPKELVLEILDIQAASEVPPPFHAIARSLGYMTDGEIERCVRIQDNSRIRIGDQLVNSGEIEGSDLLKYLQAYHRESGGRGSSGA